MKSEQSKLTLSVEVESLDHLQELIEFLQAKSLPFELHSRPDSAACGVNRPPGVYLTPKEKVLLQTLMKHDTIASAAKVLYISCRTAHQHLENIYKKLEVHSMHRAIVVALKWGLIGLEDEPDPR